MNSRERVLRTLRRDMPDRVPIFMTVTPELAASLAASLGMETYTLADSPLSQNRISFHELLTLLGNDIVGIGACSPSASPTRMIGENRYLDEWGIEYVKVGYYAEQTSYPLAHAESPADVEAFPWPDPDAPGRFDLAAAVVRDYGEEYALCGDLECTIFELSWHLTGMEKFLIDLVTERDYIFTLMDRCMVWSIGVGKRLIELGADMIWLGDDVGTQRGMLIAPEMWRRYFKDRLKRVIAELRRTAPDIAIAYHSCGSYAPIIPDLIEIGVTVLNALQPNAEGMDLSRLKAEYGDRAIFFGGIDVQDTVPFGTVKDAEREVVRVIRTAGSDGGLILAGAHNFQPDVSVEKVRAMFATAGHEGRYLPGR